MRASSTALEAQTSATHLLEAVWGNKGFPVDPLWIAAELGMQVFETELPEQVLGALVQDQGKDPVILLNQSDSALHKRINCAHKIGHYADHVMHHEDFYKYIDLRGQPLAAEDYALEEFANQFCEALLMPENEIRKLEQLGTTTTLMAQYFGVSENVMEHRMHTTRYPN